MNNPLEMMQQFQQFKKTMQGKNPNEMLNQMVNSGAVTKEQLDKATQMAKMFSGLLK